MSDESTPRTDELKQPMEWDRFTAQAMALCEQMEKELREQTHRIMDLSAECAALRERITEAIDAFDDRDDTGARSILKHAIDAAKEKPAIAYRRKP